MALGMVGQSKEAFSHRRWGVRAREVLLGTMTLSEGRAATVIG